MPTDTGGVVYARETGLAVAEFRRVLVDSGLGVTRPVDDAARMSAMLAGANFVMTARRCGLLIGVARGVTDFVWCCYLAELAVAASAQGMGVGQGLLEAARRELGSQVSLILISVPGAVGFYEQAEMARISDAFWYRRVV